MFNVLCIVCLFVQIDTASEDQGEGWRVVKPV